MSNRTRLRAMGAAALCLALTASASARTGERDTWITIARADALQANAAFSKAGREGVLAIEREGDVVVARLAEAQLAPLSQWLHRQSGHCGGFVAHVSRDAAFAEAERANRELPEAVQPEFNYTIDNPEVVNAMLPNIKELNIRTNIIALSNFFTRYHNCDSGKQSAKSILTLWQGYAQGRSDVTVQTFVHTGYTTKQPSIILTIRGTQLPAEMVVLGAHQDSIAGTNCNNSRAPGADDDASGVASLSEVIRVALSMGYEPARTVKFMAYAAEEIGLRGSNEIAANYKQRGANVVGAFQLDMTNYKGSPADIFLIGDNTNAAQNAFVGALVDTYLPGITRGTTVCTYACSDHASWSSRGYAASFPFEAYFMPFPPSPQDNPFIHTANDTIAKSGNNANHALKFAKLAAAYMAELAKGTLPQ